MFVLICVKSSMYSFTVRNSKFLNYCVQYYAQKHGIKTMRSCQIFEYGSPYRLHLNTMTPIPVVTNPAHTLVKVHAASVNPLDVRMLEGYGNTVFNFAKKINNCSLTHEEFPLILGRDFSGTVVHVGKSVKSIKCGDEVWGATSPWENGSHADFVLTSSCNVTVKPNSVNHIESASIPYAALTAWSALKCFGGLSEKSSNGKRILVTGASGGVGTFAVQLLKSWGADVTVTCNTDAVDMLQTLGADNILDYQSPDFKSNLRELKGFDLIFDNVGGEYPALTIDLLKKWQNSKYITVISPLLKNADDHGLLLGTFKSGTQAFLDTVMSLKDGCSFRWAYFMPNKNALKTIAQMIDNKQISPVIEKVYNFEDTSQAYEKVLRGHARGKVVINMETESVELSNENKQENV